MKTKDVEYVFKNFGLDPAAICNGAVSKAFTLPR